MRFLQRRPCRPSASLHLHVLTLQLPPPCAPLLLPSDTLNFNGLCAVHLFLAAPACRQPLLRPGPGPLRAAGYQYALVQEGAELARQVFAASTRGAGEVTHRVTLVRQEALEAAAAAAACAGGRGLAALGADAIARAARAADTTPAQVLANARERSLGPAVHDAPSDSRGHGAPAGATPAQAGQASGAEERGERGEAAGVTPPGEDAAGSRPGRERRKEKKRKRRAAEAAAAVAPAPRGSEGAAGPVPELIPAAGGGVRRTGDRVAGAAAAAGDGGSSDVVAGATSAGPTGERHRQPALTGTADGGGVPAEARVLGHGGPGADGKEKRSKKEKRAKERRHSHAERAASGAEAAVDTGQRA